MRIYIMAVLLVIGIVGCNSDTNITAHTDQNANSNLLTNDTRLLTDVLYKYYALKDALVDDNEAKTDNYADELSKASLQLKASLETDTTKDYTRHATILDTVSNQCTQLSAIEDATTEQQRIVFKSISDNIYTLLKLAEISNIIIYKQYCPMAFNDQGAYWLSDHEEIQNPYFGHKMPECGEIAEVLK